MKRGLALFDFDGTITTHDTLFEIIKFCKGDVSFWIGMVLLFPALVLFKLKLASDRFAKERLLSYFFKDYNVIDFNEACARFSRNQLPSMLRKEAISKIEWHQKNGDRIIVVSASAENWIAEWCKGMQLELIATQLEIIDDKVTGRLASANCNGMEKVKRVKSYLNLANHSPIYAYGNSSGDRPMLSLAEHPFYKKF